MGGRDGKTLCGLSNYKFCKGDFDAQGGCGLYMILWLIVKPPA